MAAIDQLWYYKSNKQASLSRCLNSIILNNKHLKKETRTRIYKSVIRPIVTYGCEDIYETWKTKQINETTEMKLLRMYRQISLRDKVIREDCEMEHVNKWINQSSGSFPCSYLSRSGTLNSPWTFKFVTAVFNICSLFLNTTTQSCALIKLWNKKPLKDQLSDFTYLYFHFYSHYIKVYIYIFY
jgi:hypothetical protein